MALNTVPRSYQAWPNGYQVPAAAPVNATPPDFNLDAGLYGLTVNATVFGTAQLQRLLPDAVTYIPVGPAFAAAGYEVLQLPAGQYRLLLAGVTALNGVIELISRGPLK